MLEAMSTSPAQETQLRNNEGGRGDPVEGGVLMRVGGVGAALSRLLQQCMISLASYFLKARMYLISPLI